MAQRAAAHALQAEVPALTSPARLSTATSEPITQSSLQALPGMT